MRRPGLPGRVVADRFGGDSVGEPVEQGGAAEVDSDLELAHVDALALASQATALERGEDGDGTVQAGHVVVVAEADPDVVASRHAGQIGQTGERVDGGRVGDVVRPWPRNAHSGHSDIDDLGIVRTDGVVADAPAVEHADGEVVDYDVGLERQLAGDVASLLAAEIELEDSLVAVPEGVVGMVDAAGESGAGA